MDFRRTAMVGLDITVDGVTTVMIGVTAFVSTLFKPFNVDKVIDKIVKLPNSEYFNLQKDEILLRWKAEAERGTLLHSKIESCYTTECEEALVGVEAPESSENLQFITKLYPRNKCFGVEVSLFSKKYNIIGRCDAIFELEDGTFEIVDWKRSKYISKSSYDNEFSTHKLLFDIPDAKFWHYSLQLALYAILFQEQYKKRVSKLTIVQINHEEIDLQQLHVPIEFIERMLEVLDLKVSIVL